MLVSYIASVMCCAVWVYRYKIINLFNDLYIVVNEEEVLLEIYIPRINLRKHVYNIGSSLNDVDYHIEVLSNSNLERNLYFLASHSGGGMASYFDGLVYLEKGDFIWLIVDNKSLAFIVEEVFYIQKNGYFEVSYDSEGNTLFLITCSLKYVDKQLIVKSKLIYEC